MALGHDHFMAIAEIAAIASHATRNKVGCIIVKDGNILAVGYNGTPAGFDNVCEDSEGNSKPEVLHAELNSLAKLAKSTQSSEGATLYCSLSPCINCAKLIIQAGIKLVVYKQRYRELSGIDLLLKAGINVIELF